MNNIMLLGRLTADPELRTTTTDKKVCTFTLAVKRKHAKAEDAKQVDFIKCVAWNTTAETICKYFVKGKQMLLDGTLCQRNYKNKNGENRTAYEVIVKNFYFISDGTKSTSQAEDDADLSTADFEEIEVDEDLPF